MITPQLHRRPLALDTEAHRRHGVRLPVEDWRIADRLNALFLAATEFGDACREFPIVFVKAGRETDGSDAIAPVAVLGMRPSQNLYLDGPRWRARYVPAVLRLYPFCLSPLDDGRMAICVDGDYGGFGIADEAQHALFDDAGKATPLFIRAQQQLELFEREVERTRQFGRRLNQLGLLREMRFDATLPDGRQQALDGFLTVDDAKATELPAATVHELHRSGMLAMIHQHWVSLGNMRTLVEWHAELPAPPTGAANDAAATTAADATTATAAGATTATAGGATSAAGDNPTPPPRDDRIAPA